MTDDSTNKPSSHPHPSIKVRLDKWLWAARFFKTRSLAKQAIDGGKVHYNGSRSKVSKEVELGATLLIRSGWDEKEIEIIALSDQRRGAPQAALLYQETKASEARRTEQADQRRVLRGLGLPRAERPTKKQRRQIHRFKEDNHE
jgi:ribosome-associated heat shock protein Hsp15